MRIRFLLLLAFVLSAMMLKAQNISVADFYLAEEDLTARLKGTSVEDQNGNLCALIKVKTTEKGNWAFDVGMLGVRKIDDQNTNHPAEIWVYVPFGVTWISIQHDKLGELDHYRIPCSIDKGCTYVMKLTTAKVKTYIEEETTEQWLVFEITPPDAVLEVDNKMWPVSAEGTARSMMPFGTYTYRVQAQNYHPEVGKVTVNDPENSHVVPVNLEPNFGWIEVPGDNGLRGAAVYVDNALIGKAPCKTDALKSGQHHVRILKEMYEPYTTTVTVKDNETTSVTPPLTADFAHLTLQVDTDAEIWVNDELKGTRTWTGDLRTGTYRIECKQKGHESTTTKLTVNNRMNGETINLEAPIPIYGSLNVECTPDLATLYIDGKEMGKAPKLIGKMLVGEHEIRLSKKGYADYQETISVVKGERKDVKITLSKNDVTRIVDQDIKVVDNEKQGASTLKRNKRKMFWGINVGSGIIKNVEALMDSDTICNSFYSIPITGGLDFAFPISENSKIGLFGSLGGAFKEGLEFEIGLQYFYKELQLGGGYAWWSEKGTDGFDVRIGYKLSRRVYCCIEYFQTKDIYKSYLVRSSRGFLFHLGYCF